MSGASKPDISVILVNFNGKMWLPACLKSLYQQTHSRFEVILVDNNSSDDSLAFVRQHYPQVRIIQHTYNQGFAGGNNSGLKSARGRYIMLLNTDTRLTPKCFANLQTAFATYPKLGCVQPKLIFMHEPDKLDSCGSYFTISGFLHHVGNLQSVDHPDYQRSFPVLSTKGACMMFPRSLLKQTGGLFDEKFWCYFEETDFCWRVWLAGYECRYYPAAQVYHAMGGTSGHFIQHATLHFHSLKNRLVSYTQNLSATRALVTVSLHVVLNLLLSILLLLTSRPRLAIAIWQAIFYWAGHSRAILRQRRCVQSQIRQVRDADWLPRVTRPIQLRVIRQQLLGLLTYERYKHKPIS